MWSLYKFYNWLGAKQGDLPFDEFFKYFMAEKGIKVYLARLFSKKTSRYCHSPGVVVRRRAKTFSNISVITENIYLKLRVVVHYQQRNSYQ